MEFVNDFRNELLKRRELSFKLSAESNPGFELAKKNLSENLSVSEDNVVVKIVKNNFGANDFLVEAFVYDSKEHLENTEPKAKVKKKAGAG